MAKNKLKSPKKRKGLHRKKTPKPSRDITLEYSHGSSIVLGFCGFFLLIPGLMCLWEAFQAVYLDFGILSISLICLLGSIACYFYFSKTETYILSEEKSEIIWKKGEEVTVYPFDSVIGYYNHEFDYRSSKGEELLLKTETKLLSFSSNDYYSYPSLKHLAKANFDKLHPRVYRNYYWKKIRPYIAVLFLIVILGLSSSFEPKAKINSTTITFLEKPTLHRNTGKSNNSYTWKFKAKEYPEFIFKLQKKKTKIDLKRFSENNKIGILVEEDILEMKLLKTKEPTFRLKHFGWENVFVEGLKLVKE